MHLPSKLFLVQKYRSYYQHQVFILMSAALLYKLGCCTKQIMLGRTLIPEVDWQKNLSNDKICSKYNILIVDTWNQLHYWMLMICDSYLNYDSIRSIGCLILWRGWRRSHNRRHRTKAIWCLIYGYKTSLRRVLECCSSKIELHLSVLQTHSMHVRLHVTWKDDDNDDFIINS